MKFFYILTNGGERTCVLIDDSCPPPSGVRADCGGNLPTPRLKPRPDFTNIEVTCSGGGKVTTDVFTAATVANALLVKESATGKAAPKKAGSKKAVLKKAAPKKAAPKKEAPKKKVAKKVAAKKKAPKKAAPKKASKKKAAKKKATPKRPARKPVKRTPRKK